MPEAHVALPQLTLQFLLRRMPVPTAEVRDLLRGWFPKKPQQEITHSLSSEIFHLQEERIHMTPNTCKILLQLSSVINELSQCCEEERHQERGMGRYVEGQNPQFSSDLSPRSMVKWLRR